MHTQELELLFEISHVLAVGDPEVIVRIISLDDTIGRRCRADGEDGRQALGSLSLSNLLHGYHL